MVDSTRFFGKVDITVEKNFVEKIFAEKKYCKKEIIKKDLHRFW